MPRNVCRALLFLVLAALSSSTLAWGARGHRLIAALAEQQLTPAAKTEISRILGADELGPAATWADDMRGSADNPAFWSDYANAWHFVNLTVTGNYAESSKNPKGDAVAALATFSAILLNQPLPEGPVQTGLRHYFGATDLHATIVKRFALKFLIHIVADLHQPLHSGYASDHGGNDIKLKWQGKTTNLHALWDSQLLEHDQRSEANYIARLHSRIEHTSNSDIRRMQSTDVILWLHESSELLARIHARLAQESVLDSSYTAEFIPTVDNQLVKASVRTAWVLNNLFGQLAAGTN